MIHGIEGQFGSGKTSLAVYFAKEIISFNKDTVIFTNIKMDDSFFGNNYFYFNDDELLKLLRTSNFINDLERLVYSTPRKNSSLVNYMRKKFTKYYILIDESGALYNNKSWKEFDKAFSYYINQNRKNFQEIFLISADGQENIKSLRKYVEMWYYVEPLFDLPFLRNFGIIRKCVKDEEGKIALKPYLSKDEKGDYVTKYKPMDFYHGWFYKPLVWQIYDDLYKNIPDKEKLDIDYKILHKIILSKKNLHSVLKNNYPDIYVKLNLDKDIKEIKDPVFLTKKLNR